MSKTLTLLLALSVGAGISAGWAASSSAAVPFEDALKEKDHTKIGRLLTDYIETRIEGESTGKITEKLEGALRKVGAKFNEDKPMQGALSLTSDLGKILYQSYDYNKRSKSGVKPGKINDKTIEVEYLAKGKDVPEINFSIWAPAKYKAKNGPYPVILMLPGVDSSGKNQSGKDHLMEFWEDPTLREGAILVACDMPEDRSAWTSRQTEDGLPGGIFVLFTAFAEVRDNYAIDFDRVFLAGRGPGVNAATEFASMYPHLFAGVIGRSGDPAEDKDVSNYRNLPTFFAGGGKDSTAFAERAKEAGFENSTVSPDAKEKDIWEWVQTTPRVSNPSHVTLVPGTPIPNKAYWLRVPSEERGEDSVINAKIDAESNSINIEGKGTTSVTLFLNDQLLDLSKPIKVSCNGLESEHAVARSLSTSLELIYNAQSDPGRVYVGILDLDIPQ